MTELESILSFVQKDTGDKVDFDGLLKTAFKPICEQMMNTPQNPVWHAEGDVFTHTKMVINQLLKDEEYNQLDERSKQILFISALFHDVGKPSCTVFEDGAWHSKSHALLGERLTRDFLWKECGLCGTKEKQSFRECVCALVRYHGIVWHFDKEKDMERYLIGIATRGELTPYFSLKLLRILALADIKGRIAEDVEEQIENAECVFMLASELGIMEKPFPFPNEVTRRAYLAGRKVAKDYPLYDDTFKEVILLAGIPGTGKDTFIKTNYPDMPIISLDDIREELGISPTDRKGQGKVIATAKDRARALLRSRTPFVWNATNVTSKIRQSQIELFEKYGAYTKIIFLETNYEETVKRNFGRKKAVPISVIENLILKMEIPTLLEAHQVEWIIV